jgi:hypothetical protein
MRYVDRLLVYGLPANCYGILSLGQNEISVDIVYIYVLLLRL